MLSPTRPLRIVAVSGGLQRPSKAATLAEHLLGLIGEETHSEQHLVELANWPRSWPVRSGVRSCPTSWNASWPPSSRPMYWW
jgi:hypothetical protein